MKSVSGEVLTAMLSLSTTEVLPDIEAIFAVIRSGGKKAAGTCWWMIDIY